MRTDNISGLIFFLLSPFLVPSHLPSVRYICGCKADRVPAEASQLLKLLRSLRGVLLDPWYSGHIVLSLESEGFY